MPEEQKSSLKIDKLPDSLENAIRAFEDSELVRHALGDHIFNRLILNKRIEWDQYRMHVSQYEREKYMPIL